MFRFIARPGEVEEIVQKVVERAARFERRQYERVRPDGTVLEFTGNPLPGGGSITTITDVTQRRRAEEALRESEARLKRAQAQAKLGYWRWSFEDEKLTYWSDEAARLSGFRVHDLDVTYEDMSEHVHPDDRQRQIEVYRAADAERRDFEIEYRGVRANGEILYLHEIGKVEYDENGKAIAHVGTIQDVTELRRAEQELRLAKDQAELANRAKSEFLANMSHEIRTPLNAIIGFAEMMAAETHGAIATPKYREYVADIAASANHLLDIIMDVLDVSAIEAGQIELQEGHIDVRRLVDACVRLVTRRAIKHGVTVVARLPAEPPRLRADERRVKQILLNLLTNAVKFTAQGGEVAVEARTDDDGAYLLSVQDTGIGIAPGNIARVMSPFEQVQGALNRSHDGTGLGLPLVKSFAELHGGEFRLSSKVGVGTTALVRFPAARVVGDRAELLRV